MKIFTVLVSTSTLYVQSQRCSSSIKQIQALMATIPQQQPIFFKMDGFHVHKLSQKSRFMQRKLWNAWFSSRYFVQLHYTPNHRNSPAKRQSLITFVLMQCTRFQAIIHEYVQESYGKITSEGSQGLKSMTLCLRRNVKRFVYMGKC